MDRKALSLCAAAATCSLGALLIAGCGAESASPPSTARKEPRQTAPASAVVVSPAKEFLADQRNLKRDLDQPPVSVAQVDNAARQTTSDAAAQSTEPLDPWATPAANEQGAPVQAVAPAEETSLSPDQSTVALDSPSTDNTDSMSVDATDSRTEDSETLEPTPADSEIKFATSDTDAIQDEAAEKTISLSVGPQEKKPGTSPIARSPRPVGAKSELTPVLVTPRQAPGAKLAQQNVTPVEEAIEVPRDPVSAPRQPTLAVRSEAAEVAEQTPAAEKPVAKATPTPVAVKSQPPRVDRAAEIAAAKKLSAAPVIAAAPQAAVASAESIDESPEPVRAITPAAAPAQEQAAPTAVVEKQPAPQTEPTVAEIKLIPAPVEPIKTAAAAPPVSSTVEPVASAPVASVPVASAPVAATPVAATPAAAPATAPTPVVAAPVAAGPVVAERVAAKPEPVAVPSEPTQAVPKAIVPKAAAPIAATPPSPTPIAAAAPVVVPTPVAPPEAAVPAPIAPPPAAMSQPPAAPQYAAVRSPAMVATLARADERVRHAIQLAEKGAMYASRKEFTAAISAIAQAHDVEHNTRQYSHAAAAGFQALKEASEFNASGEVDVRRLVAGHKTPVLKQFDVSDLPPTLAAQHYYNYAKEQLAIGVGRETVGSIALYGMAKLIIAGAGANSQQLEYTGPAMALYQAALICEPQNFRAAHELGVLLAGSGQLELAREMLMGSVASSPQPVMLKNLAVVHSRLGEPQLAAEAQQKADILTQTSPDTKAPAVQWVDAATFASMGAGADPANPPTAMAPQKSQSHGTEPTKTPANVARKRTTEWNPLNLRR